MDYQLVGQLLGMLFGLLLIAGGCIHEYRWRDALGRGMKVSGTVVGSETDSDGVFPVVEYRDTSGLIKRFTADYGGNFAEGDQIDVYLAPWGPRAYLGFARHAMTWGPIALGLGFVLCAILAAMSAE